MALSWSEEFSVGNALIDSEHKNLISKINELLLAIKAKDHSGLLQAFDHLEHCTRTHFANEAKIAQAINFPFSQNDLEHQYLLHSLCRIRDAVVSMSARSGGWAEDAVEHYCGFLRDWFANHITSEDMLMKPALQSHPYDFNIV